MLLLWATYKKNSRECIIDKKYIPDIVERSFGQDMFDQEAGIRTMSELSETYNPNQDSYHNGSFWPKLNGMAYGGLLNWGYYGEAEKLKNASLKPISYFKTPIELYVKNKKGEYLEFCSSSGQVSCRNQAWSAAVVLYLTSQN